MAARPRHRHAALRQPQGRRRATASSPGRAPPPTAARYVAAALAQGAAACLVEHEGVRSLRLRRRRASPAYAGLKAATGPIAAAYFGEPDAQLRRARRHRHQRQDLHRLVAGAGPVELRRRADALRRGRHAGHRRVRRDVESHRPDHARPGAAAAPVPPLRRRRRCRPARSRPRRSASSSAGWTARASAWRCSPISRRTTWTTTAAWRPTGRPRPSCSAGPACRPRWSTSTTRKGVELAAALAGGALDLWTFSCQQRGAPAGHGHRLRRRRACASRGRGRRAPRAGRRS